MIKTNKKAQIFSLIAIALLFLLFISYEIYSFLYERDTVTTRVKTMNAFLFSIEQDLERQLYISGFRTIFLAEDHITRTGEYISNFDILFNEAITDGTIYGEPSEILQGTTISEIEEDIKEKAKKMNLNLSLYDISVSIGQEDPWNIIIYFNATLNLTDQSNLARWNKKQEIKAAIPIQGFEDPIYLINSNGRVSNRINQTIYETFDSATLLVHSQKGEYINSSLAPSFIDRLEGNLQPNPNGIESLVYIPELSSQGISIYDKSIVDYIYFSSTNPPASQVSGMPSWFKLDAEHLSTYT